MTHELLHNERGVHGGGQPPLPTACDNTSQGLCKAWSPVPSPQHHAAATPPLLSPPSRQPASRKTPFLREPSLNASMARPSCRRPGDFAQRDDNRSGP
jgi:hypothetical protein